MVPDMGFLRRFVWYLLGVGLGILMVFFLFGDRDIQCAYFPNDRVLYDFRKKEILIDEAQKRQMEERAIDSLSIDQMLWHGTVDFERSRVDLDSCKEYWISHQGWSARWRNCAHSLQLLEIE